MIVGAVRRTLLRRRGGRDQLHAALRALRRLGGGDFGVHRADVAGRQYVVFAVQKRHAGEEGEDLVGRPVEVGPDRLVDGGEVGVGAQRLERRSGTAARAGCDRESAEVVHPIRGAMLQSYVAGGVEQYVEDRAFGGGEQYCLDERLTLVPAAVTADQLRPGTADGDIEDPRVGGVDEIQAYDLALCRLTGELGLPVDQHDVAEPAHCGEGRPGAVEGRDVSVFDQEVVHGDSELPVDGRPVRGVRRLDDDRAVQAHLLGEVLPHVRVVPVQAGVGELQRVGE